MQQLTLLRIIAIKRTSMFLKIKKSNTIAIPSIMRAMAAISQIIVNVRKQFMPVANATERIRAPKKNIFSQFQKLLFSCAIIH